MNFRQSQAAAEDVAETCRELGGEALVCQGNVANDADCRLIAAKALEKWGRIDNLVNNAGTTKFVAADDLEGLSAQDFQDIYAVNVIGAYQMTRACALAMRENGVGSVVNIASVAATTGQGSSTAYACSKGALITLTRGLARALGPEIRVNAVCPGFIQGEWLERGLGSERYNRLKQGVEDKSALKRAGTPDTMAEAVLFFLESASTVTGQDLLVDSGLQLGQLRRF